MRRLAVPLLLLPVALMASCGSSGGSAGGPSADPSAAAPGSAAPGSADGGTLPGEDAVTITVDAGDGTEPARYTLTCAGPASGGSDEEPGGAVTQGSLPDPEAACAQLRSQPDPFAELPADVMCTQLFGGPQTAVIAGDWAGQPVRLELSRTDGCRIAQWDRLAALLPGPTG